MKKNIPFFSFLIIIFFLFVGNGCLTNTTNRVSPNEEATQKIEYIPNFIPKNLPDSILENRVSYTFELEDEIYSFIVQPNMNTPITYNEEDNIYDKTASGDLFVGVLLSRDRGERWFPFFTIEENGWSTTGNASDTYNPVGMFVADGILGIDIADDSGAGSGEGQAIRYQRNEDGNGWTKQGCFYMIPEQYYKNNMNPKKGLKEIKISTC